MNFSKIAAIVLSGGASSRAIEKGHPPKALMKVSSGKTALESIGRSLDVFKINKFVVLGKHFSEINEIALNLKFKIVNNTSWEKGMLSSIAAGIDVLANSPETSNISGFLLWPVDCTDVKEETLLALLFTAEKNPNSIVLPSFEKKLGHPAYFPVSVKNLIETIPEGKGFNYILETFKDQVKLEVLDKNILNNKNS